MRYQHVINNFQEVDLLWPGVAADQLSLMLLSAPSYKAVKLTVRYLNWLFSQPKSQVMLLSEVCQRNQQLTYGVLNLCPSIHSAKSLGHNSQRLPRWGDQEAPTEAPEPNTPPCNWRCSCAAPVWSLLLVLEIHIHVLVRVICIFSF